MRREVLQHVPPREARSFCILQHGLWSPLFVNKLEHEFHVLCPGWVCADDLGISGGFRPEHFTWMLWIILDSRLGCRSECTLRGYCPLVVSRAVTRGPVLLEHEHDTRQTRVPSPPFSDTYSDQRQRHHSPCSGLVSEFSAKRIFDNAAFLNFLPISSNLTF